MSTREPATDQALDQTITPAPHGLSDTLPADDTLRSNTGRIGAPAALSGQTDLEVLYVLAEGGMGRVLVAKQRSLQRDVAVKTVRPDLATDALSQALHAESLIAGSLEHPNIIPIHALGSDDNGHPFLVMKRIDGVAWNALAHDPAHPAWARVGLVSAAGAIDDALLAAHLGILVAVCSATHYAHRRGVIHRDIKPGNVMVGELGEVYLVDWGIATSLDARDPRFRKDALGLVGTPGYLAPEMVAEDGGVVDERTDVYLLGATLHYLLTHRMRHEAADLPGTFELARRSEPAVYGPEIPDEIAAIANRACHRDPAARFASAAEFRAAILAFLTHRASIAMADRARARLELARADRTQLRKLLTEARYGFANALEAWPDNTRALDGQRACTLLALGDELDQRNLVGAEAMAAELDGAVPEDLAAALAVLRAEASAQRDRDARYRDLEHRTDWRRSAGVRVGFFVVAMVLSVGAWMWVNGGLRYHDRMSREMLAAIVGGGLGLFVLLIALFRARLLTTQVNRQLVYGVVLAIAAMFVNRLANIIEVPYSATLVSTELVFAALASAIGGLTLARWLWLQVPIWIAGAFVVRLVPAYGGLVFMTSGILALVVGLWHIRPRHQQV